jgi:hypothetical protein
MLFYQRKGAGKLERGVLRKELEKIVELDNMKYMKEIEAGNNKIDFNKLLAQLAAEQQKKHIEPEPKPDFDNEEPPGIF